MERVKCIVCGKDCAISQHGAKYPDWTLVMPRRHYVDGKLCEGTFRNCEPDKFD